MKLEPYDLFSDEKKLDKNELFNQLWNSNHQAIESIKSGHYPGIIFKYRQGYINFKEQDQAKQRSVVSLRAKKEMRKVRKEVLSKEEVEELLIKFGMDLHNDADKIELEISRSYHGPKQKS
ncbi:MAG: hypothetical protein HQK96_03865 [Nitrospirae bacterium]|nr:hypothetical protein [Nitrospirota bacterium]